MIFSEREFIETIRRTVSVNSERLVCGIGDDCAVYRLDEQDISPNFGIITTDALVESVHFDLAWHPPKLLGRKALSVNLSDIAAMGGVPTLSLLTVGFSGDESPSLLPEFMEGFQAVLAENKVMLIGGDTVKSPSFFISVTLLGEVSKEKVVYRSGANEGDLIWVTGSLGRAAAGLELCRRGLRLPRDEELRSAHLDPEARVKLGPLLADSGMVTSMMDISDGIATDLAHICLESRVGAKLLGENIPITSEVRSAADTLGCSAMDWAVKGGEDYELLFTSPAENRDALQNFVRVAAGAELYCVGKIIAGSGVSLHFAGKKSKISYEGYDHFV